MSAHPTPRPSSETKHTQICLTQAISFYAMAARCGRSYLSVCFYGRRAHAGGTVSPRPLEVPQRRGYPETVHYGQVSLR